jgi:amphi-Trp domain-containing protein
MEKQKIGIKTSLTYKEVIAYLKDFVKSLESGKIVLESGGEHVTLTPTENVHVKIEAKAKKDKQKLSFEISWCEPAEADLRIGDKEPEAPAPAAAEPVAGPVTEVETTALPEAGEKKDEKKDRKKEKKAKESKEKKEKAKSGKKKK